MRILAPTTTDQTGAHRARTVGRARFQEPVGKARAITHAMLERLAQPAIQLDTRVERSQRITRGASSPAGTRSRRQGDLADVGALYMKLLPDRCGAAGSAIDTPSATAGAPSRWTALAGPVPWLAEEASSVVLSSTRRFDRRSDPFTTEARRPVPGNLYLVIGQQSLLDPTRAPAVARLWAYRACRRSRRRVGTRSEMFADRIEHRIEGPGAGIRALIRGWPLRAA